MLQNQGIIMEAIRGAPLDSKGGGAWKFAPGKVFLYFFIVFF